VFEQRDASRVVTAVLEFFEPRDQQVTARTLADVSDYSAHQEGVEGSAGQAPDPAAPPLKRLFLA
jgi:hypothetical protein